MTTLLIGFDSAWTAKKSGALVGALRDADGKYRDLGTPQLANFPEAERIILGCQKQHAPASTVVLLDQPTIVMNATGQRPVENIVASAVSRRHGGMQSACNSSPSKRGMFGKGAPLWPFLARFGGAADPLMPAVGTRVFETYPVLSLIALDWTLPDKRPAGRLPKYNPERRKAFSKGDWRHVCRKVRGALRARGLTDLCRWLDKAAKLAKPRKQDQDGLDACLCLLVALHLAEGKECLMVGNTGTGYIVVPHGDGLVAELKARCKETGREPSEWVRTFTLADRGSSTGQGAA